MVQTRPRSQGHSRGQGGKKRNMPNCSNNNKATTGKCFNYRKQDYWAKEYRQPKKEQSIPVQVSILEVTKRKLLLISETRSYILETIIQDCIKEIKAEYKLYSNTEVLQGIRTRLSELPG
jgi:hypothetical protein